MKKIEKQMTIEDVKKDLDQVRLSVIEREYINSLLDLAYHVGRVDGSEEVGNIFIKKSEN